MSLIKFSPKYDNNLYAVQIPDGVAGSEMSFLCPSSAKLKIINITCILQTSAAVQNRFVYMEFTLPPIVSLFGFAVKQQTASTQVQYIFNPHMPSSSDVVNGRVVVGIPEIITSDGMTINIKADNLHAGDTFVEGYVLAEYLPNT